MLRVEVGCPGRWCRCDGREVTAGNQRLPVYIKYVHREQVHAVELEQAGGRKFDSKGLVQGLHQIDAGDRVHAVVSKGIVEMDSVPAHTKRVAQLGCDRVAHQVLQRLFVRLIQFCVTAFCSGLAWNIVSRG